METLKNTAFIDTLLPLLIVIFIIAVGVVLLYQHFQKNLVMQKLKNEMMKSDHKGELLRSNILAHEEERKHIAQDIHDELGAALSITRMNIVMLQQQSSATAPHLSTGIQNVLTLVESALTSARSISHRLMPPQLESFGLLKTLEAVIEQINKTGQLYIQLSASIPTAYMPRAINLGLYRIIMELINNTVKHSGASGAHIDIHEVKDQIICKYSDNGIGFRQGEIPNGLGYKNIDARINSLQGKFEFCTNEQEGFCVIISIPVNLKIHQIG